MATIRIPLIAKSPDALERQVSAQLETLPPGSTPTIDRGVIWDRRTGASSVVNGSSRKRSLVSAG